MSKSQRDKGTRGEQDVVRILKRAGFEDAMRNHADKVDGQGVDVTAGTLLIQVKNWGKPVPMSCYSEIKRHDGIRVLASKVTGKGKRTPWMVTLTLEDFLNILTDVGIAWDTSVIPPF